MEPDDTARRVRYWRERRGLTRRACAELLGYSEGWLQKIEQGQRRLDRLGVLTDLARVLRVPLSELQGESWGAAPSTEMEEIGRRLHWLTAPDVSDETLDHLDAFIVVIADEYEDSDAATVYPEVLGQRRWVQELLAGQQQPKQRTHLFVLAGQLSALLSYLAFDLGQERLARLYCREAFGLAEAAGHRTLMAWVRGTESFIAYYHGRHAQALELARDGQRHAGVGPHSIRLAASGEARALGCMGDRAGVDHAVGRAFEACEGLTRADEVNAFLSFDPYTAARIAGNAASAYLALGDQERARAYAELAIPTFDAFEVRASQALTRVDLSMALLRLDSPEPELAATCMADALTVGADLRSAVVERRAEDFLLAADRYRSVPEVEAVATSAAGWRTPTS